MEEYTPFASLDPNNPDMPITGHFNIEKTVTTAKNDCSGGIVGSSVTLTANTKQFVSPISIADANLQATSWLNANAQAYANNLGTCRPRTTAWRGINPTCVIEPTTALLPFDYMVIRYKWGEEKGESIQPSTSFINTGTEYDYRLGYNVSWAPLLEIPKGTLKAADAYMMSSGELQKISEKDAYLVNFKKFTTDFSTLKTVQVSIGCQWSSNDGDTENMEIEITTYRGGTMNKEGYDMINTGGSKVQKLIFSKKIPWGARKPSQLGYITYTKSSSTAEIVINY
jgi:hypothetical protein